MFISVGLFPTLQTRVTTWGFDMLILLTAGLRLKTYNKKIKNILKGFYFSFSRKERPSP